MKKTKDSKKAILQTQWSVTLHPLAERELQTIPADMQARFLHIGDACVYKKDADHTTKRD
jgi:hypothetical protein